MFIEIVHANGLYDIKTGAHSDPMQGYRLHDLCTIVGHLAEDGQAKVLYRPNYGFNAKAITSSETAYRAALASDPVLCGLGGAAESRMDIYPDGVYVPTEIVRARIRTEQERLEEYGKAVVVGLYTGACVKEAADSLKRNNPDSKVNVDPLLCLDSGASPWQPDGAIGIVSLAAHVAAQQVRDQLQRQYFW